MLTILCYCFVKNVIRDSLNPIWTKEIVVDYLFERQQLVSDNFLLLFKLLILN